MRRYQAEINSQPVTAAHNTPQKYLDGTKNISSIRHGTLDTGPAVMETILQGEYGPPLDYSFRNISTLSSLPSRWPRQSLRKQRRSPSGRLVKPCFYIICQKFSPNVTSKYIVSEHPIERMCLIKCTFMIVSYVLS